MRIFGRRDGDADQPRATYAAVLDGAHLWWHVPAHDRVTLVDPDGGAEVVVDADPFPLAGLSAARYDLRVGRRPVLADRLPDRRPSRTPLAPDGIAQYDVEVDDGQVRLVRREVATAAVLAAVGLRGDRVHLRLLPVTEPAGSHLLLLDDAGRVLAEVPVAAQDGHLDALLGADDLPAGRLGVLQVALGSPTSWVRVRRSRTDLADPNHAVLLPELADPRHPDRMLARLRWSPDGLLAVRALDPTGDAG